MAVSRFPLPAHLHDVIDLGSSPMKKITHFLHGSGASLFDAIAMSLEQAHQRLGIAAGVINAFDEDRRKQATADRRDKSST